MNIYIYIHSSRQARCGNADTISTSQWVWRVVVLSRMSSKSIRCIPKPMHEGSSMLVYGQCLTSPMTQNNQNGFCSDCVEILRFIDISFCCDRWSKPCALPRQNGPALGRSPGDTSRPIPCACDVSPHHFGDQSLSHKSMDAPSGNQTPSTPLPNH